MNEVPPHVVKDDKAIGALDRPHDEFTAFRVNDLVADLERVGVNRISHLAFPQQVYGNMPEISMMRPLGILVLGPVTTTASPIFTSRDYLHPLATNSHNHKDAVFMGYNVAVLKSIRVLSGCKKDGSRRNRASQTILGFLLCQLSQAQIGSVFHKVLQA